MTRFVLDASVAMSWCFQDEDNDYATGILDMLNDSEALVPWIWPLEVANVLLVGERRGRLSEADSTRFLSVLRAMPIMVDDVAPARIMQDILALGRKRNVSAYDASYLALAMREGLPFATMDEPLRKAATALGVQIVDF